MTRLSDVAVFQHRTQCKLSSVLCFIAACALFYTASIEAAKAAPDATTPAASQPRKGEPVVLNFVNAELDSVVQIISKLTGRNFLLDPKVKGTLSLVSLKPVTSEAVYPLFLAALRQQGLTAISLPGGVTKIVPESDSRAQPVPILQAGQKASIGKSHLYTYIHPLEYESATTLIAALRPLMTSSSAMSTLPNSNTIIVTDYAENVKKLQEIIKVLDRPAGEPKIFPLRYASATEITNTLNRLLSETPLAANAGVPAETTRVNLIADTRTNSILVRSDSLARKVQIQQWLDHLDVPTATPSNLHVVYLKNAEAARVAGLLRNVLGLENSSLAETPTATLPTQPGGSTNAAAPNVTAPSVSRSGAAGLTNNGGIGVHADTVNNALLILAPETLFRDINKIIEQMDIRRAQVFVEALVVEMSAEKAAEFGIQWQSFGGINDTGQVRAIGGTNLGARGSGKNILDPTLNLGNVGTGLNIGLVKGTISLPGIGEVLNLGLLARALESNVDANILSTPTLMTLDNEEARIVIGQNVPFITGQYTQSTTGGATPFQTIERRDVGLTLKVKPQITEGGSVRLNLYQEVSSVQDTTNSAGVITNKRSIESTVLINNGQIIVLGGLMQDSVDSTVDKVPVAGDIPIIGSLFRYSSKSRSKTNLMIFMRPTIVRSEAATERLSIDRYRYLMDDAKAPLNFDKNPLPDHLSSEGPLVPLPKIAPVEPDSSTLTPPSSSSPEHPQQPSDGSVPSPTSFFDSTTTLPFSLPPS